jgi:uncharacterized RDD family membrane protein YckC
MRRYLHSILDTAVLAFAVLVALVAGVLCGLYLVRVTGQMLMLRVTVIVFLVPTFWLSWWMHVPYPQRHNGATPAMRVLGIRIVGTDGDRPSRAAYWLRWLLMAVDGLFFGLVGVVLILVTPRRQRLGDMIAHTVVVRAVS